MQVKNKYQLCQLINAFVALTMPTCSMFIDRNHKEKEVHNLENNTNIINLINNQLINCMVPMIKQLLFIIKEKKVISRFKY